MFLLVFPIRPGWQVWGKQTAEVKCHSHLSCRLSARLSLLTLKTGQSSVYHFSLLWSYIFFLFHAVLLERMSHKPTHKKWGLRSISLHLHKALRILHGNFVYSLHLFIYSITYLFQCGLMDIYFVLCVILKHYFISCSDCFNFSYWEFFWLTSVLSTYPCCSEVSLLWVLSYLLMLCGAPGSFYVFPATVLESTIAPRSPDSCGWKTAFGTKIRVTSVPVASGGSLPFRLSADGQRTVLTLLLWSMCHLETCCLISK